MTTEPQPTPSKPIRAGDSVKHLPTGETWLVAAVSRDNRQIVCCGWPESIADASDCRVENPCSDEEHESLLREVVGSGGIGARASWARENLDRLRPPQPTPTPEPYRVDQKITEPPERGDCMIACICTVLEIPYDSTVDALREEIDRIVERRGNWFEFLRAWALGRGYTLHAETVPEKVPPFVRTIAGGESPRGCKAGHAVVCYGAEQLLHDPHPSREGLHRSPTDWMWFEPIPGRASLAAEVERLKGEAATASRKQRTFSKVMDELVRRLRAANERARVLEGVVRDLLDMLPFEYTATERESQDQSIVRMNARHNATLARARAALAHPRTERGKA